MDSAVQLTVTKVHNAFHYILNRRYYQWNITFYKTLTIMKCIVSEKHNFVQSVDLYFEQNFNS